MKQTDRSQKGEECGGWKGLAKEHTCIYAWAMGTDHNVVKAEAGEQRLAGSGQREGGMINICNGVDNKSK